ncbi:putative asparagine synthetase glutamine-hydrolyzing protein [Marine Group I thaumarchaeote SCGC AAA799-P11]|uniref:Putative asparagine synthetase glutamine-hydrolyzing protein n=1 Tax=Marine Group I thaumarchaeote SCGC AAA799-P11 TaxID=1502295 RepID=A0A087RZ94_9ARCH|nr:putative asparagine synthetase glutamine-hydrolyzing protein [Marine Group I thaumarchaeote SCGC AAA799-P11]
MLLKINKTQIQNYLTIRYDPSISNPNLASWVDFKPQSSDPSGKISEKLLVNSIKNSIPDTQTPISISLSSGIDSSICLALLRKCFPKRKIFAICGVFEDGFDESIEAKKIADTFSAEFKILQMNSIFTNMPEIISITKRPRWNTYNHLISKEARKNTNMLITGDGADELFGGYVFRYKKFLQLLKSKDNWMEKTKKYLECHNRDWVPDQNKMFDKSIRFNWNKIYNIFKTYFQNKLDPITQVMLADFNGKLLFDFMPTGKSISNHYKIKNIPIFLDDSVMSFAQKLPLSQKFDEKNTKGKLVLRMISKRLGIKHIDEKKGFSPSLLFDWKKNGKSICQSFLLDKNSNIYAKNLINFDWVLMAFDKVEYDGDIRYLNRLISILALEIWIRLFITHEIKNSKKLL